MSLIVPTWFKYRQGKAEPAGEHTYKLTAPQAASEAFITIHQASNGKWSAALRQTADGPALTVTDADFDRPGDAWSAAFELYRQHVVY
jgi:hypothetical protein